MKWAPPNFLPTKGKGLLFLDEMNSAPQAVQAAAYQLILNRKVGDYVLPPGWSVLAAGNRAGDRAVTHAMPSALANRFVHIDFEVDADDWGQWAVANEISDETRGFIRFRPNLLHSFDPKTNDRAFPTPRSWAFVDKLINSNLAPEVEYELIKGTVGEGAAAEYIAYMRLAKDLPSAAEILLNPQTAPVPEEPASLYAISTMLDKHLKITNFSAGMTYIERLPLEFQVVTIRSATAINRDLTGTKEFVKWSTEQGWMM